MSVHFRHFYDERKPAVLSCAISCSIGTLWVVLFVTSFLYTMCASVFSTFTCQFLTLLGLDQTNTVALSGLEFLCAKTVEADKSPRYWTKNGPVSLSLGKKNMFLKKSFDAPPVSV